jgi:hypothetical protein
MKQFFLLTLAIFAFAACSDDDDDNNTDVGIDFSSTVFTTNNSDGNIRYYEVDNSGTANGGAEISTTSTAADGVFYDESSDQLIQASRSSLGLDILSDISLAEINGSIGLELFQANVMNSPRETAVTDDFIVVADSDDVDGDASTPDGSLYIFSRSGDNVTLRNVIATNFKLWGITFIGNDLYAVVDADNELAVFTNFLDNTSNAELFASKRVVLSGIVRTHGLDYDSSTNTMIMTDIGDAMNTADDGGFHIIQNFSNIFDDALNGGIISLDDQIRVSGPSTLMGNPVDVAYDGVNDVVYIAEAGNGGGRLLSYTNATAGGDLQPETNIEVASISSVYLQD